MNLSVQDFMSCGAAIRSFGLLYAVALELGGKLLGWGGAAAGLQWTSAAAVAMQLCALSGVSMALVGAGLASRRRALRALWLALAPVPIVMLVWLLMGSCALR